MQTRLSTFKDEACRNSRNVFLIADITLIQLYRKWQMGCFHCCLKTLYTKWLFLAFRQALGRHCTLFLPPLLPCWHLHLFSGGNYDGWMNDNSYYYNMEGFCWSKQWGRQGHQRWDLQRETHCWGRKHRIPQWLCGRAILHFEVKC